MTTALDGGRAGALGGPPQGDVASVAGVGEQVASAALPAVWTLGELLELPVVPKVPLLGEWLRDGESVLLWAPAGAGKSLFSLSVALAVAGGGEFLGWQGTMPEAREAGQGWRVLYVDGEMPIGDIQDRAKVLLGALPEVDHKAALAGVKFLARMAHDDKGGADDFLSIATEEGLRVLLELVTMHQVDMVVLDNLSTLVALVDENSAGELNKLQNTLLALKKRNVAVILVHHSGKSGDDYRGSSRLAATMDVVLGLKVDKNKPVGEARFTLSWDKVRSRGKDLWPNTVRLYSDNDGNAQWLMVGTDGKLIAMQEMLESGKYSSKRSLGDFFGCSEKMIDKHFANGVKHGLWREDWPQECLDAAKSKGGKVKGTKARKVNVEYDPSEF